MPYLMPTGEDNHLESSVESFSTHFRQPDLWHFSHVTVMPRKSALAAAAFAISQ
jgi:hypothetical protein